MPSPGEDAFGQATYERHQTEQTLLYQIVDAHYPALVSQLAQQGKSKIFAEQRDVKGYSITLP